MRIARFTTGDDPRFGIVTGDIDDFGIPDEDSVITALAGDPLYVGLQPTDEQVKLADARLLSPVLPRSKVVGIGRNYAAHAKEMGNELPEEPLMFLKPNTSVVGPGDPVFYPRQTENLHFEGELAVVIGRICRDVPKEKWADVVHGFTVGNDVTARDLQKKDGQFTRAKGFDSFCPLGPWVETELDVSDLEVRCEVGRSPDAMEVRQIGRTKDMVFDIPSLVSYVSHVMTLLPGDVILTGTPAGVSQINSGETVSVSVQ